MELLLLFALLFAQIISHRVQQNLINLYPCNSEVLKGKATIYNTVTRYSSQARDAYGKHPTNL